MVSAGAAVTTAMNRNAGQKRTTTMKVTLESTTKIVTLEINGASVPARIWEGVTERGIRCHAFVTRIAHHEDDNPSQFQADLEEQAKPSAAIQSYPMRLLID